jgi:cyanoexosortase A
MEAKLHQIRDFIRYKYFWLFATLSSLITLHFYSIWKVTGKSPLLLDFLCWGSIFFLLWKKRNRIKFRGNFISSLIGLLLIFWMIVRDISTQYYGNSLKVDVFSGFFSFITLLGTLFVISGIKKLINYILEIIVSLTTAITSPILVVSNLIPNKFNIVANFDAQFTAFMLHYIGFKVHRQGVVVSLPNGSIEVFAGCSSIAPLATILPLVILFLFIYPTSKIKKIYVYIGVILCTIFLNAIRLSWLAIIVSDTSGFKYWHEGDGVSVFSNLIVFLVVGLSYQILHYSPKNKGED